VAVIWLAAHGKDNEPLRLNVDGPGSVVAGSLTPGRLVPLNEREQGQVWVNPQHVLYVQEDRD
jgi:hypothetical protein